MPDKLAMNSKVIRRTAALAAAAFAIALGGYFAVSAQDSFEMPLSRQTLGGGTASSANFQLEGSSGGAIGESQSPNFKLRSGFWPAVRQLQAISTLPKVRFNPDTVNLSSMGDSEVITVEGLEVSAEVDGVQINLQNPPNLSVSDPGCVDLFGGGLVIGTVPVSGANATLIGCALLGGDVNGPPDGDGMTFVLTQNGDCTEQVVSFGFGGPEGTQMTNAGIPIIPTAVNQLNIVCGVDVRSDPLTSGVQLQICPAPPCGFHGLGLVEVTLTGPISFDQTVPVGEDGQWIFEGLQPGNYTLTASSPGHLSRERAVVVGAEDVVVEDPTPLLAGDVVPSEDVDQFVNINDVSAVTAQFGQPAVDCRAIQEPMPYIDFDCNDFININDVSVVASNFIQGGARPWVEP